MCIRDRSWMACHIDSICRYRNCWNPLHLYQGTPKENVFDRHKTGAWRNQYTNITHCKRGHEYTPENTRVFNGDRQCVMCKKLSLIHISEPTRLLSISYAVF